MIEGKISKLMQFESILKKCLIINFKDFLPETKITFLNQTTYVSNKDFENLKTSDEVRGKLLRLMLDSIIDITCLKEISIDGFSTKTIVYGRNIEDGIIELLAHQVASVHKFTIDDNPSIDNLLEMAKQIKELTPDFEKIIFKDDAIKLLNNENLSQITAECDRYAISEYNKKLKEKELQNEKSSPIKLIYLNEKAYIQYIDENDNTFIFEIKDNRKIINYYKEKISNISTNNKEDYAKLFNELKEINNSELEKTMTIDFENLSQQMNSVKFVDETYKNLKLEKLEVKPEKEINPTTNLPEIQNDKEEIEVQEVKEVKEHFITKEKYDELCMKYVNNQELTDEEYSLLVDSTLVDNTNTTLPNIENDSNAGYTNRNLSIYIVLLTITIGLIIGAFMFHILN